MNNHYTRLFVAIILLAVLVISFLTIIKTAHYNRTKLDKPRKVYKFEKKRLFVDLPEEKISNDREKPDNVNIWVKNDTLYVEFFSEY